MKMTTYKKADLAAGWMLDIDPHNQGKTEQWFEHGPTLSAKPAPVPGIIQQVFPNYHGVAWYWLNFSTNIWPDLTEMCSLYFGAADYYSEIWLNGSYLGNHEGGETAFQLDCTQALKRDEANLLAVRIINPTHEAIDGFILNETPHYCKEIPYRMGGAFNHGGIVLPVELRIEPLVRIVDVFVRPQYKSGLVKLTATLENHTLFPVSAKLVSKIGGRGSSDMANESSSEITALLNPGKLELELEVQVQNPRLWELTDPYLYEVTVQLITGLELISALSHESRSRCGFRDFRLDEHGYFQLNGKRIFLKSSHTINHFPIGQRVATNREMWVRDLLYAKSAGFNMIRFIAGMAFPEQLDFCDEIGLMVYEENYAAWNLADSPYMADRFNRSLEQMILMDRNHPSLVIWGLLNETRNNPIFKAAAAALPQIRIWDDTRLVLLSSGRWDGEFSIGSVSNPGTSEWQHMWGVESPSAQTVPTDEGLWWTNGHYPGGHLRNAGDVHMYPIVPHEPYTIALLRSLGSQAKPVFLSEFGTGSMVDVIRVTRRFEQEGASEELEDASLYRSMADRFVADWQRYGMDNVYPFPENMLEDSQRIHAQWRRQIFNIVRSNPHITGYNLTGTVDQVMAGEGLWSTWRDLKPGIMDVLVDGLAPLRWCLFVSPMHIYTGRAFKIEALLANENILKPGSYPIHFKLFGQVGVVWERFVSLVIPDSYIDEAGRSSFVIPVVEEEVTIDGPAGHYRFAASLEKGAAPVGGELKFYASNPIPVQTAIKPVALLGISNQAEEWLQSKGIQTVAYSAKNPARPIILVGELHKAQFLDTDWEELYAAIQAGSYAIFLSPAVFQSGDDPVGWLPFARKGKLERFYNWLYHKEEIAKQHPVFTGLQAGGIMDWNYYDQMIPHYMFEEIELPNQVMSASFAVGYTCQGGYKSGINLGAYSLGTGTLILNTFRILENLERNPAADLLLLNLLQYASN